MNKKSNFTDIALEEGVLGQIILEGDALGKVVDVLTPQIFSHKPFRTIYEAALSLFIDGGTLDARLLVAELRRIGKLEEVGGAATIVRLTHSVASSAHITDHVDVLSKLYIRRRAMVEFDEGRQSLGDTTTDVFDQISKLQERLTSFASPIAQNIAEVALTASDFSYLKNEFFGEKNVPMPFKGLRKHGVGYMPGEVIIVGGRTGMGKTTFMMNLMARLAQTGEKSVLFSLEMLAAQLRWKRYPIFRRKKNNDEKGNLDFPEALNMKVLCGRMTISTLKSYIRILRDRDGIKIFFVDYLQLISKNPNEKFFSNEDFLSNVSAGLSAIAKELGVTLVVGCQLNRKVLDRPENLPSLGDMRGSDAIAQNADIALLLHRPDYYGTVRDDDGNDLTGLCQLIIAKNRMGKTGKLDLSFDGELGLFSEAIEAIEENDSLDK